MRDVEVEGLGPDSQDGPRVTEVPLVGELELGRIASGRVDMKDVLWFTPRPPPIESAEIPKDPIEERTSVVPVAMPARASAPPTGTSSRLASVNPAVAFGLLGAFVATVYFSQPDRHGSAIAELALAFPDRIVIDMSDAPVSVTVDDLPVVEDPEVSDGELAAEKELPGVLVVAKRSPERATKEPVLLIEPTASADPPASVAEGAREGPVAPFRAVDALSAMQAVAGGASTCLSSEMDVAAARVAVTFASSGRVTQAVIDGGPLAGTEQGGCVARVLRTARMDPFSGPPVTVRRTVTLR
jgi:hypothetical protein